MKKIIIISIFVVGFLFSFNHQAQAVSAYPFPISVTQPDGSVITIQIHGDEFLNWTTCGNKLVAKGKDGFYYNASFAVNGDIVMSETRVDKSISKAAGVYSTITPPPAAFAKAFAKKQLMSQNKISNFVTSRANKTEITKGNHRFLVLLIEFSDLTFTVPNPQTAFSNLLNQDNYSENGGTGSAANYYRDNSTNQFEPIFDVVGPTKSSKSYSYYGKDNGLDSPGARELLIEICDLLNSTVDFSIYDVDNDGEIDNVFYYYAGHNAAEGASGHIWPHKWSVYGFNKSYDGKRLSTYACTSEYKNSTGTNMCGIGTFCHEFGHTLGLPDFYDTDDSNSPDAKALGAFSLMSSGNYNNGGNTPPYLSHMEKKILGWVDTFTEITTSGTLSIEPVQNNKGYSIKTDNEGEFFMLESRNAEKWDAPLPKGLLIYHVDQSSNEVNGYTAKQRWEYGSDINGLASHQCFDLVESVYPESVVSNSNQRIFPGSSNNTSFTSTSSPASKSWAGTPTGVDITNITIASPNVSVDVNIVTSVTILGTITNSSNTPIQGAKVKITKTAEPSTSNIPKGLSLAPNKVLSTKEVTTDSEGKYSVDFEDGGTFSIQITKDGYLSYSNSFTFEKGYYTVSPTLLTPQEGIQATLKKYGTAGNSIGTGSTPFTMYTAVKYTAEELASYSGFAFKSISFIIEGTKADSVRVEVYFENELGGMTRVLKQYVTNVSFGSLTTVDISSSNIIIPAGKDVMFGYYVKNSNNGYPFKCDNGPNVPGGFLLSDDGILWDEILDLSASLDYNVCVSATLVDNSKIYEALDIPAISLPMEVIAKGQSFTCSITPTLSTPTKITWKVGSNTTVASTITLSYDVATTGDIYAIVEYEDGRTETIFTQFEVK